MYPSFAGFKVQRYPLFAEIVIKKGKAFLQVRTIAGKRSGLSRTVSASRLFHLDHFSAKVGKHPAAKGACNVVGQIKYLEVGQGFIGHCFFSGGIFILYKRSMIQVIMANLFAKRLKARSISGNL
jgi:hypothetical protein